MQKNYELAKKRWLSEVKRDHTLRLFKHGALEHCKLLFEKGIFRMGSVFDFQNEVKHGPEIGDQGEGIVRYTPEEHRIGDTSTPQHAEVDNVLAAAGGHGRKNLVFQGITFEIKTPGYIFCVSASQSRKPPPTYNSCVEIADPYLFWYAMRKATIIGYPKSLIVTRKKFRPCVYESRDRDMQKNYQPRHLIKPDRPDQRAWEEWRIYLDAELPDDPPWIDIECPGVIPALSRIILFDE